MDDVRALFPGASAGPYFSTASMALGSVPAMASLRDSLAKWEEGSFSFEMAESASEENRALFADLIGARPEHVALVSAASSAAGTVAAQLGPAKPGANVVVPSIEFTSNFFPWLLLADRGYEVRVVEPVDDRLTIDAFRESIDTNTVLVAVSHIQSLTGYMTDIAGLAELTRSAGAWLVVDGSQALGAVEMDVERMGVDILFTCSHKFLLGIRGLGYLYVRPDLLEVFRPTTPGWRAAVDPLDSYYGPDMRLSSTASRLDMSLAWFNSLADVEGLRILSRVGIATVEAHNTGLIEYLRDRLAEQGRTLTFGPLERSQIVTLDVADPGTTLRALEADGIRVSLRGGRLRASVHLYNNIEDIERLVAAIA